MAGLLRRPTPHGVPHMTDWFPGQVPKGYKDNFDATFGEQDIFKNLASEGEENDAEPDQN